jgi:hypothetical protein
MWKIDPDAALTLLCLVLLSGGKSTPNTQEASTESQYTVTTLLAFLRGQNRTLKRVITLEVSLLKE